jgi:hypothetical protein
MPGCDQVDNYGFQLIISNNHVESFIDDACTTHPPMGCSADEDEWVPLSVQNVKYMINSALGTAVSIRRLVPFELLSIVRRILRIHGEIE